MRRYSLKIKNKTYTIDVQDLSANEFRVMLNDQVYDVQLSAAQEIAETIITPQVAAVNAADETTIDRPTISYRPPAPDTLEHPRASAAPALPSTPRSNDLEITAPMPGTILSVEVKPGDVIARGQTVCILEAMKMKNAIRSPREGMIAETLVRAGQTVRYGDGVVRFEGGT